jgi:hypothetical protein
MSDHIQPHQHLISARDRSAIKGHQPAAAYGLPVYLAAANRPLPVKLNAS